MRKQKFTFRDKRVIRGAIARIESTRLLGEETTDFLESIPLTAGQIAKIGRGAK